MAVVVEVDYDQPNVQMLATRRNDLAVNENFLYSNEGKVERELILVHFGRVMTTDEVIAEFVRCGLSSAEIKELWALGIARPDLKEKFMIVAIGAFFVDGGGFDGSAFLCESGYEHDLNIGEGGVGWDEDVRFLAVRESA